MTDRNVSIDDWNHYLDDLYQWITEKYDLFEQQKISVEEYNKHLAYYEKEKSRIEEITGNPENEIIEQTLENEEEMNEKFLSQEIFENFFGVKVEGVSPELKEDIPSDSLEMAQETFVDEKPETSVEMNYNLSEQEQLPANLHLENHSNTISNYTSTTESESDFTAFTQYREQIKDKSMRTNIVLIGDSSIGKTSLRRAFMGKHFVDQHLTTIGTSIEKKQIVIDDVKYFLTLTDLGGQDFYQQLRRNFYRNIDGAILVFDISKRETFMRIDFWIKEFFRSVRKLIPFIVVGNKMDAKDRKVKVEEGMKIADNFTKGTMPHFRVKYLETSAKSGKGVNEVFETICREVRSFKLQEERKKNK